MCFYLFLTFFLAVGNAAAILTDPEKRKQYDLYGSDEDRLHSQGMHARNGDHSYHHYARFDCEY